MKDSIKPTWANTLNPNNLITLWGHISTFAEVGKKAGYPFILWNDRIYALIDNRAEDTGLTIADL